MLRYFFKTIFATFAVAVSVFSFHPASIFADDIPSNTSGLSWKSGNENIGSITLCKIIVDQNRNINDGSSHTGDFSFPEVEAPHPPYVPHVAGTIPTTHFATPLVLNADLIGYDGVKDAECITYPNLHLGSYFYAEESIEGSGWVEPLYNDQYTVPVSTLADFFPYSRHFSQEHEDEDPLHWNKNSDGHIVLSTDRPDRTVVVLNRFIEDTPPISLLPTTIVASKIICDNETDLPNWGLGGPDITSHTAQDYVMAHHGCRLANDWSFEWGFEAVTDPGRDFVGVAGSGWYTFGPTGQSGTATATIADLKNTNKIWVREVLKDGYIPFKYDSTHQSNADNKSAEMYCHDDVLNYDNFDFIRNPEVGKTYYCVAWNVLKNAPPIINHAPVITLLGNATTTITVGDTFTDPGATAHDDEDGDITSNIVITGTVATSTPGTNILRYNVKDSKGLSAEEKTRTVIVNEKPVSQCSNIVVVSDQTNAVMGGGNAVLTYNSNPRWTAVVPGASWIWKTFFVEHPLQDETNTFIKTFTVTGEIASSTLLVAADNSYKVWINDTLVGADATEFNYFENGKDIYFVANVLHEGTNTIKFEIKNWKLTGGTPQLNPAGVLYRLEIGRKTCPPAPVNHTPVITILGDNPFHFTVGDAFDPFAHATTTDPDGDRVTLYASSTVSTTTAGIYQVDYTAKDSHGLSAEPKTLTVVVEEAPMCHLPQFTSAMNVHTVLGTAFSYTFTATSTGTTTPIFTVAASSLPASLTFSPGAITGTTTATGTFTIPVSAANICGASTSTLSIIVDPNGDGSDSVNHAPVITLLGNATTTITVGDVFTDPGATAHDDEDGDITSNIVVTGSVSTTTVGTYTLHYNVKDGKGLSAEEKTRTVIVNGKPVTPPGGGGGGGGGCSGNCGGGGGGAVLLPPVLLPAAKVSSECHYLREFIKFGERNNPEEVKKLQAFLNSFEGANVVISGFYDVPTLNAVNAFQAKYKADILDPWGYDAPTGYVYLTTRKKVNEIYCHAAFPLDQNQSEEVAAFKKLLESLKIHGITPFGATAGTNNGGTENESGIVLGTTTPMGQTEFGNKIVSATGSESTPPASVTGRSAFRHLLAAAAGSISRAITSYWLIILFTALAAVAAALLRKMYKDDQII